MYINLLYSSLFLNFLLLQELHNRRLQLKQKSKFKGIPKGKANHVVKICPVIVEDGSKIKFATNTVEASKLLAANGKGDEVSTSVLRKKKKLHWGLEAKERWERKANM